MGDMKDKVRYVARLARIKLTDEEIGLFSRQLDVILGYVDKLNKKLDIQGKTPPMSHPHMADNPYRPDKVKPSLPPEKALSNAPHKQGDFFKVPRIIEE